jgi:hypothetical protein
MCVGVGQERGAAMGNMEARYANIGLGIWLFASAFIWPHSSAQMTNTWVTGVITVIVGIVSIGAPRWRYINTIVGAWLIISGFALPRVTGGTFWNNLLVGIAILLVSLVVSSSADAVTGLGRRERAV